MVYGRGARYTRAWLRTPLIEEPGPGLMGRPRLDGALTQCASTGRGTGACQASAAVRLASSSDP